MCDVGREARGAGQGGTNEGQKGLGDREGVRIYGCVRDLGGGPGID